MCTTDSNGQEWRKSVHKIWTGTIVKDDQSDFPDDLHKWIGKSHVSVMTSQCDMHLCAQFNKKYVAKNFIDSC